MENADAGLQRGKQRIRYKKITALVLLFVLLGILICLAFDTRLNTVFYTVETNKMKGTVRFAFLSDLHSCAYGAGQRQLIEAIERQKPDAVLLGGDIFDDALPHDNTEILLQSITKSYPCFYVTGNHEYWSDDVEEIFALLSAYDVKVLQGSGQTLVLNGNPLNICGIDDPEAGDYTSEEDLMQKQLETLNTFGKNGLFTVLLAHRPEEIAVYLKYPFDLVLSGHAHGGQWRIPGILNGLFSPGEGWFPRYAGGQYFFENASMIVSRGLARESTKVPRIFNRPELVIIDIIPADR